MKLSGLTFARVVVVIGLAIATSQLVAGTVPVSSPRDEAFMRRAKLPTVVRQPSQEIRRPQRAAQPRLITNATSAGESPASILIDPATATPSIRPTDDALRSRRVLFGRTAGSADPLSNRRFLLTEPLRAAPLAAKYRDRSGGRVTIGRTPVLVPSGTVSLNRFVFRRTPPAVQAASGTTATSAEH